MRVLSLMILLAMAAGPVSAEPSWEAVTLEGQALLPETAEGADAVARTPPTVHFVRMTDLPDPGEQGLWSSWGDGLLHRNGNYYTSIGDHRGEDATSWVLEYNPDKRVLLRVIDTRTALGQPAGAYGHGKIHAKLHEAADGAIWFATYWGKHREIEEAFERGYRGSGLMRYDPATGKVENIGPIVEEQGLPASHFDPQRQWMYLYAVYENDLVVYDVTERERVFLGGRDRITSNRTFMRDRQGRVYVNDGEGRLHRFDPEARSLERTQATLADLGSGGPDRDRMLRAAILRPTADNRLYGMDRSGRLFRFDPDTEAVQDLGPNFDPAYYTAVMALSPDERFLYYAPGAHGGSVGIGSPIVQYEIATGRRKILASLEPVMRERFGYVVGGSYNLRIDEKGERLFVTFNGAPADPDARRAEAFGEPSMAVIEIPESER